ncbi:ABC transporter permease subunit [Corynebacterium sp. 3HC-13]|uniref:ABC transporter permease n=1 Tax=Corynebacterium poyangense TaxID=2684405 RepID=UPI001CCDA45E|nr:ABC transporter permease [Corynebacterium poyangense]MBZ8178259.1 ABC transporter permease subunit [Corynebacterium poyangense]
MSFATVLQRCGQALLVLLVTYALAFILLSALPSDAVMARFASPELGLSAEEIAAIRQEYGVDRPLILQFFISLWGFIRGDFGYSVQTGTAVSSMIREALPGTIGLALAAFLLAILLTAVLAVLATVPSSPWLRSFINTLPGIMVSLPSFWIGVIIIQVVSFQLGWIPVIQPTRWQSLILPALTLSIPIAAPLTQIFLRSIEDTAQQPFISVVRSRGASRWWIFSRNIFRNALLPTLTMAGLLFGELVGGAVVTEAVFGRAGIGHLTVNAVANRDTPVLLAVVIIAATTYVIINLIVDLLYPVLDPRLRRKARS